MLDSQFKVAMLFPLVDKERIKYWLESWLCVFKLFSQPKKTVFDLVTNDILFGLISTCAKYHCQNIHLKTTNIYSHNSCNVVIEYILTSYYVQVFSDMSIQHWGLITTKLSMNTVQVSVQAVTTPQINCQ